MAKIWVEAYGCSASFADSEMINGIIVGNGHTLADNPSNSDLNLIVTCSVKDATANRMVNRIKRLNTKPLVVAGCLPKAEPETVERFGPRASMLGPNSLGKTLDIINSTLKGVRRVEILDTDESKVGLPKIRLNPAIGIIEIATGCMSECTFCQTKLAKGNLQSFRIGDIVRQVEQDLREGCKEIWLTSTDNGCYGLDIGTDLPTLVSSVANIEEEFMIRVGMMNPMYMPRIQDSLLQSFENSKVFKFLHVPVQSGSNQVLNNMKRGHSFETYKKTVKSFRKRFERFTISTDIIVGFPTETEDDFEDTINLLEETQPDIVNLSRYSARPGTEATSMNQINVSIVKKRSKKLFGIINEISLKRNLDWIGWKGEVLFDENSDGRVKGRNYAYKPVMVDQEVELGKKALVEIIDASKHVLNGKIMS